MKVTIKHMNAKYNRLCDEETYALITNNLCLIKLLREHLISTNEYLSGNSIANYVLPLK